MYPSIKRVVGTTRRKEIYTHTMTYVCIYLLIVEIGPKQKTKKEISDEFDKRTQ